MIEKMWIEKKYNLDDAYELSKELNISLLMAKILCARGIYKKEVAHEFLFPSLKNLLEPYLFADMKKAVLRISQAIYAQEKIGVFGDYDVDGVCSTAIFQQFLEEIGVKVVSTLPNRMTEGYGLSFSGIDRLKKAGAKLLLTLDCGILSHEQIDYANSLGLDVIVVDHHTVGETLPNACAVINPKRNDCSSGADYLCAAGVSFFLCIALRRHLREQNYFVDLEPDLRNLLDLVALATVCDVVPLLKENRALVKFGLRKITEGNRLGLAALMDVSGIDKNKITCTNLGFHLGPRINATGRLQDATLALDLMNCKDNILVKKTALKLDEANQSRKIIEEETLDKVIDIIESNINNKNLPVLIVYDESFHPGVVGIVAGRIAERYHRPAIIIGEKGKGSGRSIKGIDLHAMVCKVGKSLAGFGGHAHAIGITLGAGGVEIFSKDLIEIMDSQIDKKLFNKELTYDVEVSLDEINLSVVSELIHLGPFGAKNSHPILRINNSYLRNLKRLTGGHIKGEIENTHGSIPFIGFRMDIEDELANSSLDILSVLEKNEWQGRISVQCRIIDYKKSSFL
jgi:single-stranded-DNA-specific exonuclease